MSPECGAVHPDPAAQGTTCIDSTGRPHDHYAVGLPVGVSRIWKGEDVDTWLAEIVEKNRRKPKTELKKSMLDIAQRNRTDSRSHEQVLEDLEAAGDNHAYLEMCRSYAESWLRERGPGSQINADMVAERFPPEQHGVTGTSVLGLIFRTKVFAKCGLYQSSKSTANHRFNAWWTLREFEND